VTELMNDRDFLPHSADSAELSAVRSGCMGLFPAEAEVTHTLTAFYTVFTDKDFFRQQVLGGLVRFSTYLPPEYGYTH